MDFCDIAAGACDATPDDSLCDDSLWCTGVETCDPVLDCRPGSGSPCPPAKLCREADDQCVDCLVDGECDDADPCTGIEVCNPNGSCATAVSQDCNGNGIEDSCDVAVTDCNENGTPDDCDISGGASQDWNENAVPDDCEILRMYVNPGALQIAGGGAYCMSWANPCWEVAETLTYAPDAAGAEIWVAAGTYRPDPGPSSRGGTFPLLDTVTLHGGFAGDELSAD